MHRLHQRPLWRRPNRLPAVPAEQGRRRGPDPPHQRHRRECHAGREARCCAACLLCERCRLRALIVGTPLRSRTSSPAACADCSASARPASSTTTTTASPCAPPTTLWTRTGARSPALAACSPLSTVQPLAAAVPHSSHLLVHCSLDPGLRSVLTLAYLCCAKVHLHPLPHHPRRLLQSLPQRQHLLLVPGPVHLVGGTCACI